jgi:hypothetical protein
MDNNDSHYKLKHLIEEDDGIFTVFIVEASQLRNIQFAKNADTHIYLKLSFFLMCQILILMIKIIDKTRKRCCCRCGFSKYIIEYISVRSRPEG